MWATSRVARHGLRVVAACLQRLLPVDRKRVWVSPVTTDPLRNAILVPWIWLVMMSSADGFHPDLSTTGTERAVASLRTRVHHVRAADLSSDTAQTAGMQRFAAISGTSVGSEKIWMGETYVSPEMVSDNHHHGESETAIFVRTGSPEFVFHDGRGEVRIATVPGDYVFVPPYVPHREENPDPNNPAVIVIARSTQEAIVVNLPALYALPDKPNGGSA
jgi:uncharacterized RmlC-like cupin family protein